MSTTYHPQSEIVNKCLKGYLRAYASDKSSKWTKWLHLVEYWLNTMYHCALGMAPFKALYGYEPPSIKDLML